MWCGIIMWNIIDICQNSDKIRLLIFLPALKLGE